MGHTLLCVLSSLLLNTLLYGETEEFDLKATLTADRTEIPAWGSVTLTCSVDGLDGWNYELFRNTQSYRNVESNPVFIVYVGGVYSCRGWRPVTGYVTEKSDSVTVHETVSSRVSVTLLPSWSEIYRGEKITVRCEIQGGGDTEWTYEWKTTSSFKPPSLREFTINSVTESHRGDYSCRGRGDYWLTLWSGVRKLTVSANKPRASLRASDTVLPAGGSVTLTCSVYPSSGWKYNLYRDNKLFESLNPHDDAFKTSGEISVSEEGVYRCRGGRGDPVYYTEDSQEVRIINTAPNRAVVTLQPNWPEIYRGETITVSCEIQGGDTEWTYEWETPTSIKPPRQHEYRISPASSSHSGDYRCRGRVKSDRLNTTEWSDSVRLTVYDDKPVLTVSPSWLSPGASVTLKCELGLKSAGWRFFWSKAVPDPSQLSYRSELLPGSSSGTEQDSYMVHGQTHTAGYVCRAGRGDPVVYTETSEPTFVWSGDVDPSASLTVSPDRVQHFTYQHISLRCEGNSTERRLRRFPKGYYQTCSDQRIKNGSSCKIYPSQPSDAVYWCESGSGEFSNSVNITTHGRQYSDMILSSPVHPVTEGESVILSCEFWTNKKPSSVFFYQNNKLIQNDTRTELNISAVSKSDEGFYRCESSGKKSVQSWLSVRAEPKPESSSLPLWLIVGLICGIVLIIVALLFVCRRSTSPCGNRLTQTQRENQDSVHHDENQQQVYSSLIHGDACVYESIRGAENTGQGQCDDAELYVNLDPATGP